MKSVYTHENIAMVQNAKNLLENNDIKVVLKNEFASGGAGDLVPTEIWPELCVLDDNDHDHAAELLQALSDKSMGEDWICEKCNEHNGAMFEICWNCQSEPM